MAWAGSGLFTTTFTGILDASLTMDFDTGTHKIALYNNTTAPAYDAANTLTRYDTGAWVIANEVDGGSWPAGGYTLVTPVLASATPAAGQFNWDAVDVSQATTTISDIYGGFIYNDTETNDTGICGIEFSGAPYSTSNGTLAITWDTNGIFYIDLVP